MVTRALLNVGAKSGFISASATSTGAGAGAGASTDATGATSTDAGAQPVETDANPLIPGPHATRRV